MVRAGAEMERDSSEREAEDETHTLLYNFVQKRLTRLTLTRSPNFPPGHRALSHSFILQIECL